MRFEIIQVVFLAGALSGCLLGILIGKLFAEKKTVIVKQTNEPDAHGIFVD